MCVLNRLDRLLSFFKEFIILEHFRIFVSNVLFALCGLGSSIFILFLNEMFEITIWNINNSYFINYKYTSSIYLCIHNNNTDFIYMLNLILQIIDVQC